MKAVYLVLFELKESKEVEIGAKGTYEFESGIYGYVGSAMNGVEPRVKRHLNEPDNKHWHIDYFSSVAEPIDYFILPERSQWECKLSNIMENMGEPQQGLGSSDCGCNSHLYKIETSEIESS